MVAIHVRPPIVELGVRLHDVVAKTEIERQVRSQLEVVLRPERIGVETSARRHLGILDDVRRIQLAQQIARIRIAARRIERSRRAEPRRLQVAEAERGQAAVGSLTLVGVHALRLQPERRRVPAMRPAQIVLQREVVQILRERARICAAPSRWRVRSGEGRLGE